jgi:hypothetical protein
LKLKKNLFTLSLLLCLLLGSTKALAYIPEVYKFAGTPTIWVDYTWGANLQSAGTVIRNGFTSAVSDWNSKQTKIKFYYLSSSANKLDSYFLSSSSEYGSTDTYINPTTMYVSYFISTVNAGNPNITQTNVARSVANHELGHSMGLDDNNSPGYPAVMDQNRTRSVTYTPQADDVNGINNIYK